MNKKSCIRATMAGGCTQYLLAAVYYHIPPTSIVVGFILVAIIGYSMGNLLNTAYDLIQIYIKKVV